ncbi:MAG TPA: efflux RND transporter periplasmic adaptor subunit [Gemmataceae bacterium]|nr:efflux RND transporter periplasmic adaptor subunit [Gemmataceae bacterium]
MTRLGWIGSILLLLVVLGIAAGLGFYKYTTIQKAMAAAADHPEPMESVTVATATEREHRRTTTAIGTVVALRSITLKNELPGTVREVVITPGQVVEAGTVLVALDVSVEQAELKAQEAQLALAETVLARARRASQTVSVPEEEVDKARAQRDIAVAQIARTKAVIAKKTIRAPFKARVGLADVHPGQYLAEGTQLTTLQGVDPAAHVDFSVPQAVAMGLKPGDGVDLFVGVPTPIPAQIVAVDARIDHTTRNAMVRARVDAPAGGPAPAPGAAVRVRVPVGGPMTAVAAPASAMRKGPQGDHVFIIAPGPDGKPRAKMRTVETGTVVGDDVLIVKGLAVGEQVAASGSFKLRDGVLVAVAGDPPAGGGR